MAQLGMSRLGLWAILGGLTRMNEADARRERESDVLAERMRDSTRMVGQALERQGAMMTEALQGRTQQGRGLEELWRRTAEPPLPHGHRRLFDPAPGSRLCPASGGLSLSLPP